MCEKCGKRRHFARARTCDQHCALDHALVGAVQDCPGERQTDPTLRVIAQHSVSAKPDRHFRLATPRTGRNDRL